MRLLTSVQGEDLEFLTQLDKRLRGWEDKGGEIISHVNMQWVYRDANVNEEEIKGVLNACMRNGLAFSPTRASAENPVVYTVTKTLYMPQEKKISLFDRIKKNTFPDLNFGVFDEHLTWNEELLGISEKQMPKNYQGEAGFKKLANYFMAPKNLELAKAAGLEIRPKYNL